MLNFFFGILDNCWKITTCDKFPVEKEKEDIPMSILEAFNLQGVRAIIQGDI